MTKTKSLILLLALALGTIGGVAEAQRKAARGSGKCLDWGFDYYECGTNSDGTIMICMDLVCTQWEFVEV
jgi:hypothetical protein